MLLLKAGIKALAVLAALSAAIGRAAASERVSCKAAMVIEDHMAFKRYTDTAITSQADGPPGSGEQGGWTLAACKEACKSHGTACSMISYSAQQTVYTPAGYCELWGAGHTAAEFQHTLVGVDTYVEEGHDSYG